jgi:hypothetical protein
MKKTPLITQNIFCDIFPVCPLKRKFLNPWCYLSITKQANLMHILLSTSRDPPIPPDHPWLWDYTLKAQHHASVISLYPEEASPCLYKVTKPNLSKALVRTNDSMLDEFYCHITNILFLREKFLWRMGLLCANIIHDDNKYANDSDDNNTSTVLSTSSY